MMHVPTIESSELVLSSIRKCDIDILHNIMTDWNVKRFMPDFYEIIKIRKDFISVLKSFYTLWQKREAALWGIYRKDNLIGFVGLMDIITNATIFYSIDKDNRGLGLAKQSVSIVIDYVEKSNLSDIIHSHVAQDNIASIKVLQHNGFIERERKENIITFTNELKIFTLKDRFKA